MKIKIKNYTKQTDIEVNILSNKIKDALDYIQDYIYIYKMNDDKIKIEVVK